MPAGDHRTALAVPDSGFSLRYLGLEQMLDGGGGYGCGDADAGIPGASVDHGNRQIGSISQSTLGRQHSPFAVAQAVTGVPAGAAFCNPVRISESDQGANLFFRG